MPITEQQLESIKAANLAKSVAWEAAHFLPGDIVLSHGYTARRTDNAWICNTTGLQYATLSRWGRAKLNRRGFDTQRSAFLTVGLHIVQMCCLPPVAERHNYSPWTVGRPIFGLAPEAPAPKPVPVPESERLDNRIEGIDGRLDHLAAWAVDQHRCLKSLESRTESGQEDHHRRLMAMQERIDSLEASLAEHKERLLATATVAAFMGGFKERIEALERKA